MKKILVLLILLSISLPVFAYDPNSPNLIWDAKAQKYKFNYNEIEFKYDNGKLVKIGDNIVKYNSVGRIETIGDMPVKYDSKDRIIQVGDKKIHYKYGKTISSITSKNWLYMRAHYSYNPRGDELYRIGDYYIQYDDVGRIKYLIKF
ncbi:TPA: hypothetical protein CPT80_06880 [Candidatus Gastranaerophilales bacterium HUM_9]|nr:MAG TPA: hypothetical protein CPT80_06880 [Candidatus Gastranaerophilales bacterium HUM_9]HBX35282.1 hypothetical protein [Cyanobacteria bacterium UBA11440]